MIPGAYRSDLVRLCLLHHYGGSYNDMGHQYLTSLNNIVDPSADLVLVNERTDEPGIHNAFMSSFIVHHPILEAMVTYITENIEAREYGENSLDITGPMALGKCIEGLAGYEFTGGQFADGMHVVLGHHVQLLQHRLEGEYLTLNGDWVIKTKFSEYADLMYRFRNTPSYHQLWPSRQVYRN